MTRFARDRHQPALARMLVLAVAAARPVEIPTIFFDEFDGFPDFHPRDAIVRASFVNTVGEEAEWSPWGRSDIDEARRVSERGERIKSRETEKL